MSRRIQAATSQQCLRTPGGGMSLQLHAKRVASGDPKPAPSTFLTLFILLILTLICLVLRLFNSLGVMATVLLVRAACQEECRHVFTNLR